MTGWLDCSDCNDLLLRETCVVCDATPETLEYSVTAPGLDHFFGPLCPECMARYRDETEHEPIFR